MLTGELRKHSYFLAKLPDSNQECMTCTKCGYHCVTRILCRTVTQPSNVPDLDACHSMQLPTMKRACTALQVARTAHAASPVTMCVDLLISNLAVASTAAWCYSDCNHYCKKR